VSCRRTGKLGCRSNSPSFCVTQATSHVSSELYTFRCLVGHVCQRCGPVSRNTVGTMVDVCQVMIVHTIICKIQASRLTTLVCNESRCSCSYTEILVFLTTKLELPSPLLSDSPFSPPNSFFCFSSFSIVRNAKSRPTFWHAQIFNKGNCRYWKFHFQNPAKTKIETLLLLAERIY
jgi:hypothetical protein